MSMQVQYPQVSLTSISVFSTVLDEFASATLFSELSTSVLIHNSPLFQLARNRTFPFGRGTCLSSVQVPLSR